MECLFDKCELFSGMLLGVISGIVSSLIFIPISRYLREVFYFRPKYRKLSGTFHGFRYKEDKPDELEPEPISSATVKHLNENLLEISVSHGSHKWSGEITMSSTRFGSIIWQYENLDAKHFFGFKRCIVEKDYNTLLVIGEQADGMGKEVFKKVNPF